MLNTITIKIKNNKSKIIIYKFYKIYKIYINIINNSTYLNKLCKIYHQIIIFTLFLIISINFIISLATLFLFKRNNHQIKMKLSFKTFQLRIILLKNIIQKELFLIKKSLIMLKEEKIQTWIMEDGVENKIEFI